MTVPLQLDLLDIALAGRDFQETFEVGLCGPYFSSYEEILMVSFPICQHGNLFSTMLTFPCVMPSKLGFYSFSYTNVPVHVTPLRCITLKL